MNKRKVVKLILVTILLLFGIVFFAQRRVVKIAITSSGVSPSYATILKGQRIEFSSSVGKYFWIASDPHPSHVFLPTFDSKEPVPVGKTWVHEFNEPGVFQYHDHMQPSFRGTIKVVETNPVAFIYNRLLGYYKLYFEKHDDAYIQSK